MTRSTRSRIICPSKTTETESTSSIRSRRVRRVGFARDRKRHHDGHHHENDAQRHRSGESDLPGAGKEPIDGRRDGRSIRPDNELRRPELAERDHKGAMAPTSPARATMGRSTCLHARPGDAPAPGRPPEADLDRPHHRHCYPDHQWDRHQCVRQRHQDPRGGGPRGVESDEEPEADGHSRSAEGSISTVSNQ